MNTKQSGNTLSVGMVGVGMIFDETYRPVFEALHHRPLYTRDTGAVDVVLAGVASRTGSRTQLLIDRWSGEYPTPVSYVGANGFAEMLDSPVKCVCVATPDNRHFDMAIAALSAGKHVLIEKPSVLSISELDQLMQAARINQRLCKVVYHKLFDPDHKKLRTLVLNQVLQHVNNGYCSLLEPKSISTNQFAEWISGRNPGTYVAVHYLKLIDFSFGHLCYLKRISATGQRGIVHSPTSNTWDSVQLQVTYQYPDQREATFDIHTNWVTPDNFTGYVEQEVQFRFDNAIWLAHQRKRGVELAIEGRTPQDMKNTPNHHYNGTFIEPWGESTQRGYGLEAIQRFFEEVAYVEFGVHSNYESRLEQMSQLQHNSIAADRNCVAIVQAMEAILEDHANGQPGSLVEVNTHSAGLLLHRRNGHSQVLYPNQV